MIKPADQYPASRQGITDQGSKHRAQSQLTFGTDVEQSAFEGQCDRQTRQRYRGRPYGRFAQRFWGAKGALTKPM